MTADILSELRGTELFEENKEAMELAEQVFKDNIQLHGSVLPVDEYLPEW